MTASVSVPSPYHNFYGKNIAIISYYYYYEVGYVFKIVFAVKVSKKITISPARRVFITAYTRDTIRYSRVEQSVLL